MSAMASQITSLTIVCSVVCSDADQGKHQSSASLAFVRGIHQWTAKSPHKVPVTRKMFPFDDVIMWTCFNGPPYHDHISNQDIFKACLMSSVQLRGGIFAGKYLPYLYIGVPYSNGQMISKFFILEKHGLHIHIIDDIVWYIAYVFLDFWLPHPDALSFHNS